MNTQAGDATKTDKSFDPLRIFGFPGWFFLGLAFLTLLAACAAYGPYHANTLTDPLNSVRGPADGRYKLAFIEFGDQGSALDTSQRTAALEVIQQAKRPLLFVYIHGWQNNAESADVCKFEHFIDTVSRYPEITGRKLDVIGVYVAWRGLDITLPVAKFLTFYSRKSTGYTIAAQNGCLATISELALAARAPDKTYHHCVLLGHSCGGLVLENTISHSILDASSAGTRNTSPWGMAVAFNAADSSIGSRQLSMYRLPMRFGRTNGFGVTAVISKSISSVLVTVVGCSAGSRPSRHQNYELQLTIQTNPQDHDNKI
jgi:hypothetical protein